MSARVALVIVTALLVGCAGSETGRQADAEATTQTSAQKHRDVYVARASLPAQESMSARFEGRLLVEKGCLVLKSDATTYLPVFSAGSDIQVGDDSVTISGQPTKLGQIRFFGGGEAGKGFEKSLIDPIPSACRFKLLRLF